MKQGFYRSKMRELSAIILAVILAFLFWLAPGFDPASTFSGWSLMYLMFGIFSTLLVYLTIQGVPIVKGNIGNPSAQNTDAAASTLPGIVSIFALGLNWPLGFWSLSSFWVVVGILVVLVTLFDLFILGGAAAKILYLTDETKIHIQ